MMDDFRGRIKINICRINVFSGRLCNTQHIHDGTQAACTIAAHSVDRRNILHVFIDRNAIRRIFNRAENSIHRVINLLQGGFILADQLRPHIVPNLSAVPGADADDRKHKAKEQQQKIAQQNHAEPFLPISFFLYAAPLPRHRYSLFLFLKDSSAADTRAANSRHIF